MTPELKELFQSGDFTIVYWDRDEPTIYRGNWDFEEEYDKDEYEEMNKHVVEVDMYDEDGYVPDIVSWLVECLGGRADSI